MALSCTRGGSGWILGKKLRKNGEVLKQDAQGRWRSHRPWRFEKCVCVALGDMVSGHGGVGPTVGLDDLRGLL